MYCECEMLFRVMWMSVLVSLGDLVMWLGLWYSVVTPRIFTGFVNVVLTGGVQNKVHIHF